MPILKLAESLSTIFTFSMVQDRHRPPQNGSLDDSLAVIDGSLQVRQPVHHMLVFSVLWTASD